MLARAKDKRESLYQQFPITQHDVHPGGWRGMTEIKGKRYTTTHILMKDERSARVAAQKHKTTYFLMKSTSCQDPGNH